MFPVIIMRVNIRSTARTVVPRASAISSFVALSESNFSTPSCAVENEWVADTVVTGRRGAVR
jgi:hypothetical protein